MQKELAFGNIWSAHKAAVPRLLSLLIHATLVFVATIPAPASLRPLPLPFVQIAFPTPGRLIAPVADKDSGGGGGGRRAPTPASLGKRPRPSDRQLVPPDPELPRNVDPSLAVEVTIIAPQLASLPQLNLISLGDPFGVPGPPSPGPGSGYGIGTGKGHGDGDGDGPGADDGRGGGTGGDRLGIRGGITSPVLLRQILPEYSEEARKARFQGSVILATIIREDGSVQIDRIARGLGFGLDEKAIEAVLQWKFQPGRRNGKPVAVPLYVEVNFNLR